MNKLIWFLFLFQVSIAFSQQDSKQEKSVPQNEKGSAVESTHAFQLYPDLRVWPNDKNLALNKNELSATQDRIRKRLREVGIHVLEKLTCDHFVLFFDVTRLDSTARLKNRSTYVVGAELRIDKCMKPGGAMPPDFIDGLQPIWVRGGTECGSDLSCIQKAIMELVEDFIRFYSAYLVDSKR